VPDAAHHAVQFRLPSAGNHDRSTFVGEALGKGFSDACIATSDNGHLPL
jgi:hypothetical protein